MEASIIDRGRGPEIRGTRITVYDVWDYARDGEHPSLIAATLGISSAQVQAALDYIERHKDAVLREYARIVERAARGNPPELQARLDAAHKRFQEMLSKRTVSR